MNLPPQKTCTFVEEKDMRVVEFEIGPNRLIEVTCGGTLRRRMKLREQETCVIPVACPSQPNEELAADIESEYLTQYRIENSLIKSKSEERMKSFAVFEYFDV